MVKVVPIKLNFDEQGQKLRRTAYHHGRMRKEEQKGDSMEHPPLKDFDIFKEQKE